MNTILTELSNEELIIISNEIEKEIARRKNEASKLVELFTTRTVGQVTIAEVTDEYIKFSNDSKITFDHEQDCCEYNYADFKQLDDLARNATFTLPLSFEECDYGFRFGNEYKMYFVPCYSDQNGYYSNDIDIYFDGRRVLNVEGKEDF